ncbi:MAG: YIP1 family protein [Syntrophobacteraceae bacterium]
MAEKKLAVDPKAILGSIMETFQGVIRAPASFYRQMPLSGGYTDPLIFAAVMGIASGIVRIVMGLLGFSFAKFFMLFLTGLIVSPILTVLWTFVAAAILFVIWQLMGSRQSYEVSFRCAAYMLAISPVASALNFIPYLGIAAVLVWMAYILVCASVEVHGTEPKIAWVVFGAICAVVALGSISMQHTARSFQHRMESMGKGPGDIGR